ncbi:MAG: hypothetical protein SWH61_02830 [Thermodesulfobacteriota bacterium]|nr:hypothetical protein [Thermodesulfobacteriota bacterium]
MNTKTAICLRFIFLVVSVMLVSTAGIPVNASGQANGERFTVTVMGTGTTETPDPAAARRAAIKDGLAAAVDAAVVAVVPEDILAANFAELDALFSGNTESFILRYSVLAAMTPAGKEDMYCRALVQAVVPKNNINAVVRKAGILIDRTVSPRVLLAVYQQIGEKPPVYWWQESAVTTATPIEREIAGRFAKRGIETVDPSLLAHQEEIALNDLSPDLADTTAVRLGRHLGADFVITGQLDGMATYSEADNSQQWQGHLALRLLDVATGRQIVQKTATVTPAPEIGLMDEADFTDEVAKRAVHLLSPVVVRIWDSQKQKSRRVNIRIQGDDYLSKLGAFRKILESMVIVKAFQMTEMTIDGAVLVADVEGDAAALADALSGKQADRLRVKILDMTGTQVTIALEVPGTSP